MNSQALQQCLDEVPRLVREAAGVLDFTGGTSVAEVADCASDQSEYTVYLTSEEFADFYAAITREVFQCFGFDGGSSDGSSISAAALEAVAKNRPEAIRRGEVI